jgi:hypothetical protein
MPSPNPIEEYVKDIIAATTESNTMLWKSGMKDIMT